MSLNIVHLVGRAGRNPETRVVESSGGSSYALSSITIAVRRPTSKTDEPDWFNLKCWGKTAEIMENYVRKGSLIGVQGTLSIETWTDKDTGAERSTPVIKVDRLDLLGSRQDHETEM
jgi:single-strand DNA-binding protein